MGTDSKWKDEYVFQIYDLTKDGYSCRKIAKVLGVGEITLNKWKKKHPMVRMAINYAKHMIGVNEKTIPTFKDYVFQRLPKKLRRLWRQIDRLDKADNGFTQIQALLEGRGRKVRQHLFLYAWTRSNFSISQALRKVCISRATFEKWQRDPDFLDLINEIQWHKKNFFEDALFKLVKKGDSSAVLFVNKTQNADKGYNEKQIVQHQHQFSGSVGIEVNVIKMDELDLPLSVRKAILQAARQKKQIASQEVKALPAGVPPVVDVVAQEVKDTKFEGKGTDDGENDKDQEQEG